MTHRQTIPASHYLFFFSLPLNPKFFLSPSCSRLASHDPYLGPDLDSALSSALGSIRDAFPDPFLTQKFSPLPTPSVTSLLIGLPATEISFERDSCSPAIILFPHSSRHTILCRRWWFRALRKGGTRGHATFYDSTLPKPSISLKKL